MADVPPPPKLPPDLLALENWLRLLWQRTGAGSDAVATANTAAATSLATAQSASVAAATAQQQADSGPSATAQSGTDTASINLTVTDAWVEGPQVDLTGVAAGALTITGSGPTGAGEMNGAAFGQVDGEFRIVEDIGGVDEVLGTFTFSVTKATYEGYPELTISENDAADVSAFTSARSSTGAVSYRLDFRKTTSRTLTNLACYLYARRA